MESSAPSSRSSIACCCSHITKMCVEKAFNAVSRARPSDVQHDLMCIECHASGSSEDMKFRQHFLNEQHYILVRTISPIELYCCHCGDYQYSESFDDLVGRKRSKKGQNGKDMESLKAMMLDRRQPRGIVNMGSTCFMGSVLQVLLNNPVVILSRQMQQNRDSLLSGLSSSCKLKAAADDVSSGNSNSSSNGHSSHTSTETGSDVDAATKAPSAVACIACEFRSLFWEPSGGKGDSAPVASYMVPSNLLYAVWAHADYMAGYDQQDAHEFLIALLDGVGSHLEKYHGELNSAVPRFPSPPESTALVKSESQRLLPTVKVEGTGLSLEAPWNLASMTPVHDPSPRSPRSASFKGFVNEVRNTHDL